MEMRSDENYAWLSLYSIPGLGNTTFKNLLDKFGTPEAVFEANIVELSAVVGVSRAVARRIVKKEFSFDPEKELRRTEQLNARIIVYISPSYPRLLKEIYHPPMLLYARGKDIPADQMLIAVVGSRNPTQYGVSTAEKIGKGLAKRRVSVVSGLAKGIDSAAHRGCLAGKGFTIAVMGTGIDLVYPGSNKKLYQQIAENGTIITEFPLGSPPEPKNFPIRNRIISGLSRGIAVVEATRNSGSLITASLALEQGRDVFAVPGSINSFKSTGAHFLIKQGAKLIENADDILNEFGFFGSNIPAKESLSDAPQMLPVMDESEHKLYEIAGNYPMHMDEIVRLSNMDASEVSSILMKMELKGLLKQLQGKMFVR